MKTRRRAPGDGSLFQRSDGMWVARLELGFSGTGGRLRWQAASKTHAGALAKLREARAQRDATGIVARKTTTERWLRTWLGEIVRPTVKPTTFADYRLVVNLHLVPSLGHVPLDRLAPSHVRAMLATVTASSSTGNANKCHRVLRAALSDAEREGLVPRNVAKLVQTPTSTVTRPAMTAAQARTLITATAGDPMASRWLAALLTGARQGELLGLEWDRVDLKAGTLDLAWQLQGLGFRHGCVKPCGKRPASCPKRELDVSPTFDHRPLVGPFALTRPKSAAGRRVIPVPGMLLDALKAGRRAGIARPNPFGLVWTAPDGGPLARRIDSAAWHEALKAAGLPPVPLHSARHTTATLLMDMGVDVTVVQAILGHAAATTTKVYQHADLTMTRKALDGLGVVLSGG